MYESIEDGTQAFPFEYEVGDPLLGGKVVHPGMTLRAYAAIKLCVPNSGVKWLDDMIREAKRDQFAGQALTGWIAIFPHAHGFNTDEAANLSYEAADAMLKAREITNA